MNNQKEEKQTKKKKVLKRVILICSALFSLFTITVFVITLLCFDPYKYPTETYRNLTNEKIHEEAVVLSSCNAKDTKKVSYELNELEINELFYNSFNTIRHRYKGRVTNFYLETENGYDFVFEANLIENSLFSTRLKIHTELKEDADGYIFDIESMFSGKINQINFIKGRNIIDDEVMNELFADIGLSIKSDLANNRFLYSYEDILNDYENHRVIDDEFFLSIFDEFTYQIKSPFSLESDLSRYCENETYVNPERSKLNINLDNYKRGVAYLIQQNKDNKYIAGEIYKYFLKGYDSLNETEKTHILALDLTEFGVTDKPAYKGVQLDYKDENKISYIVKDAFEKANVSSMTSGKMYSIVSISENDFSKLLRTSIDMFKSSVIACHSYLSTFTISDIYSEIVKDHIYLNFVIDIDGLETFVSLDFKYLDTSDYKASFSLSDIKFGKENISSELATKMKNIFKETINTMKDNSFISITDNVLFLDFKDIVLSTSNGIFFTEFGKGSIELSDTLLKQEGKIDINFKVL